MKKKIILGLSIIIPFSLYSCRKESKTQKYCLDTMNNIDSFIYFDSNNLIDKINMKNDFCLVIGQMGCESCENIKPLLKQYISNYKTPLYWIETTEYKKVVNQLSEDSKYSLRPIITSASLLLFDDGIDKDYIEYDSKIYNNYQSLENKLNRYFQKSGYNIVNDIETYNYGVDKMYRYNYLTTDKLDQLIASDKEETILFSWYSCPDCSSLKDQLLDQYLLDNDKSINIFEVDEIRNHTDEKTWASFKRKYQFDNYRDGRVPSIVTYKNSTKIDMAVFQNDLIEEKDNSFVVTESFWNDEVKSITGSSTEEVKEKVAKKEIELITQYLDKHI